MMDLSHIVLLVQRRYRHAYFEVLEQVCGEIERRFDQSDLSVVQKIESFLIESANGQHTLPRIASNS